MLYKQCTKAGLRLAQVPQHTLSEHLSIHSFIGATWVAVPQHNHTVTAVMELSLRARFCFLPDSKQLTDWRISFPFLHNHKPSSSSGSKPAPPPPPPQQQQQQPLKPPMVGPKNFRDATEEMGRKSGDAQYIHSRGLAMVSVWLMMYGCFCLSIYLSIYLSFFLSF
jgi:hypothetical protein